MNPVSFGILTTLLLISSYVQGGRQVLEPVLLSPNGEADSTISRVEFLTRGIWSSVIHNSRADLSCNDSSRLFPVPGSRKKFYLCGNKGFQKMNSTIFMFSCPEGMTFNAELSICRLSSFALKSSEEKKVVSAHIQVAPENDIPIAAPPKGASISLKQKRSVKFVGISSLDCQEEANKIIAETSMISTQISHIDDYIDHLKTRDPIELPNVQQMENYLKVLKDYNVDLQNAKNNGEMWRTENGVFAAMKEALLLAKNFEPKFKSRFEFFLHRVGVILNDEGNVTSSSEKILIDTIANITDLRALLSSSPDQLILLDHFEDELKKVRKAYEEFSIKYEIPNILRFLEFVEHDVNEINLKVEKTEDKIFAFEKKTYEDYDKFQRHKQAIEITTVILQEEKIRNEKNRDTLTRKKTTLVERRITARRNLARVFQKKREAEEKLTELRQQRTKRSPVNPAFKIIGGGLLVGFLLKAFYDKESAKILDMEISSYKDEIALLESLIKNIEKDNIDYDKHLSESLMKIESLQYEVLQLTELQRSLIFMENQLNSIVSSLANAKNGISKVKIIYQDISSYLKQLIGEAMESKLAIEQREFRYFIYNEIGTMKCLWHEVSHRLSLFDGFQ